MGVAFAFGWTPCVGPILGAILTMAAEGRRSGGRRFAAVRRTPWGWASPSWCAGCSSAGRFGRSLASGRYLRVIQIVCGAVLVVYGVLLLVGVPLSLLIAELPLPAASRPSAGADVVRDCLRGIGMKMKRTYKVGGIVLRSGPLLGPGGPHRGFRMWRGERGEPLPRRRQDTWAWKPAARRTRGRRRTMRNRLLSPGRVKRPETVRAPCHLSDTGVEQKVIKDAVLELEVEEGKFQTAFNKAQLLADRYGGYVLSSNAYATNDEDSIKSGTVAISVPVESFDKVMTEAGKLGTVKGQSQELPGCHCGVRRPAGPRHQPAGLRQLHAGSAGQGQDHRRDTAACSRRSPTPSRSWSSSRASCSTWRANTSYSTLTMNIYESRRLTRCHLPGSGASCRHSRTRLHNVVDAFSAVVRGLGWLIPVLDHRGHRGRHRLCDREGRRQARPARAKGRSRTRPPSRTVC